jgi:hypothetical protein
MDIDNQKGYWDKVAEIKTFTHPNRFRNTKSLFKQTKHYY